MNLKRIANNISRVLQTSASTQWWCRPQIRNQLTQDRGNLQTLYAGYVDRDLHAKTDLIYTSRINTFCHQILSLYVLILGAKKFFQRREIWRSTCAFTIMTSLTNAVDVINGLSHSAIRETTKEGTLMRSHISAIFAKKLITDDICWHRTLKSIILITWSTLTLLLRLIRWKFLPLRLLYMLKW